MFCWFDLQGDEPDAEWKSKPQTPLDRYHQAFDKIDMAPLHALSEADFEKGFGVDHATALIAVTMAKLAYERTMLDYAERRSRLGGLGGPVGHVAQGQAARTRFLSLTHRGKLHIRQKLAYHFSPHTSPVNPLPFSVPLSVPSPPSLPLPLSRSLALLPSKSLALSLSLSLAPTTLSLSPARSFPRSFLPSLSSSLAPSLAPSSASHSLIPSSHPHPLPHSPSLARSPPLPSSIPLSIPRYLPP